jgi:hypothetical protein
MSFLQKHAWVLLFAVGLLLLVYAYDNIVVLSTMPPDDPERGWAWLTQEPEILDYIQMWFRTFGLWVLAVAVFVLVVSATGYRSGQRWAFFSLLYMPVHILIHMLLWPWLIPLLAVLLLVTVLGLALPFRQFFPKELPT